MKESQIQVGKTYKNRGKGRTRRTVLEISKGLDVPYMGREFDPDVDVVRYSQEGEEYRLVLKSFAAWAGGESSE